MKRFFLLFVACLSLVVASAWLVTNPAWAGSSTATCADGSTRTCTGTDCASSDDRVGVRGYCQCSSPDGSLTTKYCPLSNPDGGDGGGGDIAPILP